jgi:hypothetical protein
MIRPVVAPAGVKAFNSSMPLGPRIYRTQIHPIVSKSMPQLPNQAMHPPTQPQTALTPSNPPLEQSVTARVTPQDREMYSKNFKAISKKNPEYLDREDFAKR